jgi:hypothetical protein
LSLRHGGYSVLRNERRAHEIREELIAAALIAEPADAATFDIAANLLARAERALLVLDHHHREEIGDLLVKGAPPNPEARQHLIRLSADCRGWLNSAARLLAELGMSPAARAKLGLHLAQGKRTLSLLELHAAAALELDAEEDVDDAAA